MLWRDKSRKMTFVASEPGKDVQEAILHYRVERVMEDRALLRIRLVTGRTHQIRVQFASRKMPLFGERKYSTLDDSCELALWSGKIGFNHPKTGEWVVFAREPESVYPWFD